MAGLARLLDRLCAKLAQHRRGARRVDVRRVDRGTAQVEIGLARPMRDPERVLSIVIDERIDVEIVVLRVTLPEVERGFPPR